MFDSKSIITAAVLSLACGRVPPDTLSIGPGFSDVHVAVIHDARDQWCEAVGWCPEFVEWFPMQRGAINMSNDYARICSKPDSGAFNDGDRIIVNPTHPSVLDIDTFVHVSLHELGHFGIEGHPTKKGLMHEERVYGCIDQETVDTWCEEQPCDGTQKTTCTTVTTFDTI